MTTLTKNRIKSLDLLKGIVMVVMALDHTRDFFHSSAYLYSPTDPTHTTLPIYLTRWITHFCAPAFCFLAGISAFIIGRKKSKIDLSLFLFKRGLWLVFIELTVVNFAWYFDIHYNSPDLMVIWSLGISMMVLAALVHLPRNLILILSCIIIFGHNLLDTIHFPGNIFWAILHETGVFYFNSSSRLFVDYPIIPWISVMSLGYCFGMLYDPSFDSSKRKKILNIVGVSSITLFILLRYVNNYGDPIKWISFDTTTKMLFSFFNPSKYPPSLLYLLMTLGPVFLFLSNAESLKGKIVNFFSIFGRVPFFYYLLHLYLIHLLAMMAAELTGYGWQSMLLPNWVTEIPSLKGFGFSLPIVYLIWLAVIYISYPLCKIFDNYKMNHKEKWWLSYL